MTETLRIGGAIGAGLRKAMEDDPKVLIMGEDVGKLGGVFRVTDGLQKDFGEDRVLDTPLAESGIVGTAIGLAIRGRRPVVEIQFNGFVYPAFDQIVSQLAKMHYRSRGTVPLPIVVRIPCGGGIGAVEHHSESPEAYFAHTAGLKVVSVSNSHDAYWGIQQAIACDDPVIFFEPLRRYQEKGQVDLSGSLGSAVSLFGSKVERAGEHATVVAWGSMMKVAHDAAGAAAEENRSVEVINMQSLSPMDMGPIFDSVRKTGRLVVVHEAPSNVGIAAEVAARVTQECFYSLESPVLRVTGYDTPYPAARLEEDYLPDLDRVLDAVDRTFTY